MLPADVHAMQDQQEILLVLTADKQISPIVTFIP